MKEKIVKYIETWEQRCYYDGIPDEVPLELERMDCVPSYKKICIAIIKNDINLKTLGFTAKKSRYYSELKYDKLWNENKIKQLRMRL